MDRYGWQIVSEEEAEAAGFKNRRVEWNDWLIWIVTECSIGLPRSKLKGQ